jgi:hypothetical protein
VPIAIRILGAKHRVEVHLGFGNDGIQVTSLVNRLAHNYAPASFAFVQETVESPDAGDVTLYAVTWRPLQNCHLVSVLFGGLRGYPREVVGKIEK